MAGADLGVKDKSETTETGSDSGETKTNSEGKKTGDSEEKKTDSDEKKTDSEEKKTNSEEKKTDSEEKKTNSEEKKTNSEEKKTSSEEKQTTPEGKKNSSKIPKDSKASDDEDVPQDFFDDFSNPDFMEGLNIVDAWDDQGTSVEGSQAKSDGKKSNRKERGVKFTKERKTSKSKDRINDRSGRSNKYNDKYKSGTSSDYRGRRGSPRSRSKPRNRSRSRDKQAVQKSKEELRRDPEKTRRDMEKYKVKYEKTQEKKTITEKLKVVETGLVPPGMEMDVDLSEVLKTTSNKNDTPVKDEKTRSKSKSLDNEQQSRKPPVKRRQESPSYDSKKSTNLFRYGSRSPLRFRRSRSREYRRSPHRPYIDDRHDSKSKPRMRRRSNSLDHNMRHSPLGGEILKSSSRGRKSPSIEKRRWVRVSPRRRSSRTRSREPRRRRSRSLSEREAWIRDSKRAWRKSRSPFSRDRDRERDRDRDRDSPRRKRHRDMKQDPKKISFLEEIHQLLSGKANPVPQQNFPIMPQTIAPPMQMQNNAMVPGPVTPRPVPAPILISFPPPRQAQGPLDMNFFIGDNHVGNNMMPQQPQHNMVRPPPPNPIRFAVNPVAQPPRLVNNMPKNVGNVRSNLVTPQTPAVKTAAVTTTSHVQQKVMPLKIPTLTANTDRGNNTPIQATVTKEEAAKLFESKKLALSDFLTITTNKPNLASVTDLPKKVQVISRCQDIIKELGEEMKSAPLVVKFEHHKDSAESSQGPFTSPLLKNRAINYTFTSPQTQQGGVFNRKLSQLLAKCGIVEEVIIIEDTPEEAPPPAAGSPLSKKPALPTPAVKTSRNMLMKMVQTLPYKCEECERRNNIVYVDEGVQCTKTFASIGIQATEDAVEEQTLKNKSLASLTPAQLLMSETRDEAWDSRERFNEKRFLRPAANAPFRGVGWEDDARALQFAWGDPLAGPSGDRSVPYVPGGGGRMERFPIQGREPPFPDRFRRY